MDRKVIDYIHKRPDTFLIFGSLNFPYGNEVIVFEIFLTKNKVN